MVSKTWQTLEGFISTFTYFDSLKLWCEDAAKIL